MQRMFRRSALAIAVAALAAATLAGAPTASAGSCTAGVKTLTGGFQRTFCGPASVTVKVAGGTIELSQGNCAATSGYLAVNIGVFSSVQGTKPKPNYFGFEVGRVPGSTAAPAGRDGTYRSAVVMTLVYGGRSYSVIGAATATLSDNRTRGTVTGTTFTKQAISASFHC